MSHKDKLKTTGIDTSHIKRDVRRSCFNCALQGVCIKRHKFIYCPSHVLAEVVNMENLISECCGSNVEEIVEGVDYICKECGEHCGIIKIDEE